VGREEETELLLRRWARAKAGEGQVVLIGGEAGIGKSRLRRPLWNPSAANPIRVCAISAHRSHTDSALYPILAKWNVPLD
jgi:predicted ATPase